MAQTTFDLSGSGGLAPKYYGDFPFTASTPNLRYLGGEGQLAEGIYNPLMRHGYLSPANDTTKAVTGTTDFLLTSYVYRSGRIALSSTDVIFFADEATTGTQGKVVNLDNETDTALDTAYTIPLFDTNKYSKVTDMITYQVNGVVKNFFTRINTTGSIPATAQHAVGIAGTDFSSPDPDWSINAATGGAADIISARQRPFFVLADNNLLYLLATGAIHKIDGGATGGTNGTITRDVLTFVGGTSDPGATRLVDGIDFRSKMWIGLHVNGVFGGAPDSDLEDLSQETYQDFVGVYIWDRRSTVATIQDFIPITGVKQFISMHKLQNNVCCFTVSVDGYTQLRMWDGSGMKLVKTLGKGAHPNFRRHSLFEGGDYIMWLGADGKLYYYGQMEVGDKNALHILGDMTNHVTSNETFSTAGILCPANGTETVTAGTNAEGLAFYLSFSDSGGNHLKKWYPFGVNTIASNAQTGEQGDVYTLVKYLPTLSTVRDVNIRCVPTGTGSGTIATIKYYFNQSSTVGLTKTVTKDEASKGYIHHHLNKANVNSIQMEIEWSTSETLGADTFSPSVAIVTYNPTDSSSPDNG